MSRLLTLNEKIEWSNLLDSLPIEQQDIYYTPEYYELYENKGDGEAKCFVFERNDDIALYPFLLNSVNDLGYELDDEYFDIQGAYGYNGVVSSSSSQLFRVDFSHSFIKYCHENKIIAEFTRFNPILKNQVFSQYLSVNKMNNNIIVDLTYSEDDIWNNLYEHSVRKNVRKALRNELTIKIYQNNELSESLQNDFKDIYYATLKRNNADNYYYFDDDYFINFIKNINNNGIFCFTIKNDIPISCELVTYRNNHAYSFLGGTLSEYYPYRPNDLLKHEIILYLKNIGVKYFCLGGGQGNDGIYKYKKSFSKLGETDFYTGSKIYDQETYDYLCKTWSDNLPVKSDNFSKRLLRYREQA
jgi:hypothetical protein